MTHRRVLTGLTLLIMLLGVIHLFPRSTSATVYTQSLPEPPQSVAVDAPQQRIVLITQLPVAYAPTMGAPSAHLHVLDLSRGTVLDRRTLDLSGPVLVLALDAARHRLVLGGSGTGLVTLDTMQDVVQHTVALAWPPLAAALDPVRGQTVVLGADGTLSLLDTGSGRLLRQRALARWAAALALDPRTHTLVVSGWRGDGGWVRLLDAATLRPRRTVRLGGATGAVAVAVGTRRVFVLHPADQTVSMLTEQGRLLGTIRVGQSDGSGVMTVDEATQRVFVANTHDDTVSVLDDHSGRVLRTVRVGALPDTLLVDDRAHRVVVVNTDDGTLSVLDAATGALRATLAVGPNPAAAVDEGTGRLVVVSGPSAPPAPSWMDRFVQAAPWLPWHVSPSEALPGSVRLLDLTR